MSNYVIKLFRDERAVISIAALEHHDTMFGQCFKFHVTTTRDFIHTYIVGMNESPHTIEQVQRANNKKKTDRKSTR